MDRPRLKTKVACAFRIQHPRPRLQAKARRARGAHVVMQEEPDELIYMVDVKSVDELEQRERRRASRLQRARLRLGLIQQKPVQVTFQGKAACCLRAKVCPLLCELLTFRFSTSLDHR